MQAVHRDIGLALAARLQRTASFRVLPRKRRSALEAGQGDVVCAARMDAGQGFALEPALHAKPGLAAEQPRRCSTQPADCAGRQPVGTVLGLPIRLQAALGDGFVRMTRIVWRTACANWRLVVYSTSSATGCIWITSWRMACNCRPCSRIW
jgi:hypothetical protein